MMAAVRLRLSYRRLAALCLSLTLARALADSKVRAEPPLRVAITIDDLPGSAEDSGYDALRLVSQLIDALRAHRVGAATGFVVGERLASDAQGRAAVAAWVAAGFEVGNHTYSHPSLHRGDARAYIDDVLRMEPLMHALEQRSGQRARYFRYPFLEEGRSEVERRLLARLLRERGYTVARVSVDFSDWAWGDPYARCLRRGDPEALALLSRSYVDNALAYLAWSEASAQRVLRRPFVHVLLLHANLATAHNLDALLSAYERAGAQFVPLSEALADAAYTADYAAEGGHVLTLASQAAGRALPPRLLRPLDLLDLACR
jgi:peptidoglycan-N-acetylglucosamine deacetylase